MLRRGFHGHPNSIHRNLIGWNWKLLKRDLRPLLKCSPTGNYRSSRIYPESSPWASKTDYFCRLHNSFSSPAVHVQENVRVAPVPGRSISAALDRGNTALI